MTLEIFQADFHRLSILRPREISIMDKIFMRAGQEIITTQENRLYGHKFYKIIK